MGNQKHSAADEWGDRRICWGPSPQPRQKECWPGSFPQEQEAEDKRAESERQLVRVQATTRQAADHGSKTSCSHRLEARQAVAYLSVARGKDGD